LIFYCHTHNTNGIGDGEREIRAAAVQTQIDAFQGRREEERGVGWGAYSHSVSVGLSCYSNFFFFWLLRSAQVEDCLLFRWKEWRGRKERKVLTTKTKNGK
jgi:hypothetical protein